MANEPETQTGGSGVSIFKARVGDAEVTKLVHDGLEEEMNQLRAINFLLISHKRLWLVLSILVVSQLILGVALLIK